MSRPIVGAKLNQVDFSFKTPRPLKHCIMYVKILYERLKTSIELAESRNGINISKVGQENSAKITEIVEDLDRTSSRPKEMSNYRTKIVINDDHFTHESFENLKKSEDQEECKCQKTLVVELRNSSVQMRFIRYNKHNLSQYEVLYGGEKVYNKPDYPTGHDFILMIVLEISKVIRRCREKALVEEEAIIDVAFCLSAFTFDKQTRGKLVTRYSHDVGHSSLHKDLLNKDILREIELCLKEHNAARLMRITQVLSPSLSCFLGTSILPKCLKKTWTNEHRWGGVHADFQFFDRLSLAMFKSTDDRALYSSKSSFIRTTFDLFGSHQATCEFYCLVPFLSRAEFEFLDINRCDHFDTFAQIACPSRLPRLLALFIENIWNYKQFSPCKDIRHLDYEGFRAFMDGNNCLGWLHADFYEQYRIEIQNRARLLNRRAAMFTALAICAVFEKHLGLPKPESELDLRKRIYLSVRPDDAKLCQNYVSMVQQNCKKFTKYLWLEECDFETDKSENKENHHEQSKCTDTAPKDTNTDPCVFQYQPNKPEALKDSKHCNKCDHDDADNKNKHLSYETRICNMSGDSTMVKRFASTYKYQSNSLIYGNSGILHKIMSNNNKFRCACGEYRDFNGGEACKCDPLATRSIDYSIEDYRESDLMNLFMPWDFDFPKSSRRDLPKFQFICVADSHIVGPLALLKHRTACLKQ